MLTPAPSLKHSRSPLTKAEKRETQPVSHVLIGMSVYCSNFPRNWERQKEKQHIQRTEKQNVLCAACGLLVHGINWARRPRAGSRIKVPKEEH